MARSLHHNSMLGPADRNMSEMGVAGDGPPLRVTAHQSFLN